MFVQQAPIPQIFWYNAFIILSNGSQSRIGSTTGEWEHFAEWKHLREPQMRLPQTLTPGPSPSGRGAERSGG